MIIFVFRSQVIVFCILFPGVLFKYSYSNCRLSVLLVFPLSVLSISKMQVAGLYYPFYGRIRIFSVLKI